MQRLTLFVIKFYFLVGGSAPTVFEHCSFSIGGKNGLNGSCGMQLVSASKIALQQAGPMFPNFPMSIDCENSAIHPGIFIKDDKHFVISGNPGTPGLGRNGNGKGNGAGNCGNWAFADSAMHKTARRKITFLKAMMKKKKMFEIFQYMILFLVCCWVMNNTKISCYL